MMSTWRRSCRAPSSGKQLKSFRVSSAQLGCRSSQVEEKDLKGPQFAHLIQQHAHDEAYTRFWLILPCGATALPIFYTCVGNCKICVDLWKLALFLPQFDWPTQPGGQASTLATPPPATQVFNRYSAANHPATRPPGHLDAWAPSHLAIQPDETATQPPGHPPTWPLGPPAN